MNFQDVLRDYNSGQNQGGIYKNTAVNPGQVNTAKSGFSQFMGKTFGSTPMSSPLFRQLTQSPTQGTVTHTPAFNAQVAANPVNTASTTPTQDTSTTPTQGQTGTDFLDDATKAKIVQLGQLGVAMQGNPKMQEAIYNEMLNQYVNALFPQETGLTDYEKTLNMYDATGGTDERLKDQALREYYAANGQNYNTIKSQDALIKQFQTDFPTEGVNGKKAVRNAKIQAQARENPSLLEQYYKNEPTGLFSGSGKKEQALKDAGFTF